MTYQAVGIGSAANDGTGDPLRTAFTKVNANFVELYTAATVTAAGIVELATTAETTTGTDTTRAVTPAGVKAALDALIAAAPGALNTLDELAAALGDDANFAATVTTALAGKVNDTGDVVTGILQLQGGAFGQSSGSIADDAVYDFGDVSPNGFALVFIWAVNGSGSMDAFAVRARTSGSPSIALVANFGTATNIATTTSNVTGTTGTDTKITVSATSAHLKVENRSGAALTAGMLALRVI